MILTLTGAIFFLSDAAHTLSAPTRWNRKAWLVAGATVSTGAVLFLTDDEIRRTILDNQCEGALSVADRLDQAGNGLWLSAGLLTASGVGLAIRNRTLADAGLVGMESWLLAGAVSQLSKYALGRARPNTGEGPCSFDPIAWDEAHHSLPSGHATVAFAGLSGFGFRTGNPWVVAACLGLASGVAWARVYQDVHWTSDVFWGTALGIAIGYSIARKHTESSFRIAFEDGKIIYRF
ncbi:MAG: phosphatase PAP2 family protein [candidate division WOR-3 bacterium]